jgi:SAM-dependent methyltransferase
MILKELQQKGRLDSSSAEYFSRPLQDRPSLQLTLRTIRSHLSQALILDLGCGMGSLEAEITKSNKYECIGLDANKLFVHLASDRLKLHFRDNVSFVQADLRNPPFRGSLFDFVVLHDVAFAVNISSLMDEIARMLKRKGRLLFDVPMATFYLFAPVQRPFIKYSKHKITIALNKKRFREERVFLLGMPPILHERFHMPLRLMRGFSRLFVSLPDKLQKLLAEFWFAVFFVANYGEENV